MPLVYRESLPVEEPRGTVLCLHGWPETSYMWRDQLEAVADAGWQAVAPDLPGYGDSPLGELSGTWTDHVSALDEFHREQELGEVVLVVHDWGGLIGLRWACEHPDLVRAMVISNTGFFADGRWHGLADVMRTPDQGETFIDGVDREAFGAMLKSVSPKMDDRALDEYFKAYSSEERRRGMLSLYRSGEFSELEDYDLTTVRAPSLILWGADDPFAPVAGAHRFDAELDDTTLVVVEGAGHFVYDDEPERCSREIVSFLERV
jgi:haloalkane dehalogenase